MIEMMLEDLTGKRFGRLTVLRRGEDYVSPKGRKRPRWICRCDCGNEILTTGPMLKNGNTRSCGCLQKELLRERQKIVADGRKLDLTGQRFGRLTAKHPIRTEKGIGVLWLCQCDCGNEATVPAKDLKFGKTKSCGCLRDDKISKVNYLHGESHTRLYNVWNGMRQRCKDKNHKSYKNYGGRGITYCQEWDDFRNFKRWAVENDYNEDAPYGECTLDRIDVNGNYEPGNCRWVSESVQASNKRKRSK